MNDHFEDELKQALARVLLPEKFAERVLDRLPASTQKRSRVSAFLAIAAVIALAASLTFNWHRQQEERKRVQRAQQQLVLALRFTAEKLMVVETRLKRSAPRLQIKKEKEQL